jgi:hypothetical protein
MNNLFRIKTRPAVAVRVDVDAKKNARLALGSGFAAVFKCYILYRIYTVCP